MNKTVLKDSWSARRIMKRSVACVVLLFSVSALHGE